MTAVDARPHFVYELAYDEDGDPLYIGVTWNFATRMANHLLYSEWARSLVTMHLTRYESRWDALDAERRLIGQHCPPYNLRGNGEAQSKLRITRQERMAAEHAADSDCPYHWRGCRTCHDELNALIG